MVRTILCLLMQKVAALKPLIFSDVLFCCKERGHTLPDQGQNKAVCSPVFYDNVMQTNSSFLQFLHFCICNVSMIWSSFFRLKSLGIDKCGCKADSQPFCPCFEVSKSTPINTRERNDILI